MLQDVPCIAAAYVLGSAVRGELRPDSDIDIALLPQEGEMITLQTRLQLGAELELRLKRSIDIGVISSQNLVYAYEAILKGERIFAHYIAYVEANETRFLGCYLTFRQDRKVVEERYRAE